MLARAGGGSPPPPPPAAGNKTKAGSRNRTATAAAAALVPAPGPSSSADEAQLQQWRKTGRLNIMLDLGASSYNKGSGGPSQAYFFEASAISHIFPLDCCALLG